MYTRPEADADMYSVRFNKDTSVKRQMSLQCRDYGKVSLMLVENAGLCIFAEDCVVLPHRKASNLAGPPSSHRTRKTFDSGDITGLTSASFDWTLYFPPLFQRTLDSEVNKAVLGIENPHLFNSRK